MTIDLLSIIVLAFAGFGLNEMFIKIKKLRAETDTITLREVIFNKEETTIPEPESGNEKVKLTLKRKIFIYSKNLFLYIIFLGWTIVFFILIFEGIKIYINILKLSTIHVINFFQFINSFLPIIPCPSFDLIQKILFWLSVILLFCGIWVFNKTFLDKTPDDDEESSPIGPLDNIVGQDSKS